MSNKLTSRRYPFLPLSIRVRVAKSKLLDLDTHALIDTGFSGDIVIPATKALLQSTPGASQAREALTQTVRGAVATESFT